jgi:hypothetical protein
MKVLTHLLLALVVSVGFVTTATSEITMTNVNNHPYSYNYTAQVYEMGGCEAIRNLFVAHPIPIGSVDEATGREIVGWEIDCEDDLENTTTVATGGTTTGGTVRTVIRAFGSIKLRLA